MGISCTKCGSDNWSANRSPVEPADDRFTCKDCGHKWNRYDDAPQTGGTATATATATAGRTWTINAIKQANRAAGFHWFDPDTMRAFGSQVLSAVYQGPGGVYFVTCDDQYRRELPKRYTVRTFNPETGDVGTAAGAKLVEHDDRRQAISAARAAAAGRKGERITTTRETYKPVSILEQFAFDLRTHGNPTTTEQTARVLIRQAGYLERFAVAQCNGEWPYGRDHDGETDPQAVTTAKRTFTAAALLAGASGVVFGGDPRGCVAKLTFADGFTNDFGKEGYCVPTTTAADDDQ